MRNGLIDLQSKARAEYESTRAFSLQSKTNLTTQEAIMPEHEIKQKRLEAELLRMKIGTLDLEKTLLESKLMWLEIELDLDINLENGHE
jgi:hypothetical protein